MTIIWLIYGEICGGGKVKHSFNSGNITISGKLSSGALYLGGVIGAADGQDLIQCYNTGNIISTVETNVECSIGGLTGFLYNINSQNCYNIGNVYGENFSYIGSLFGRANSQKTFSNVYYNSNSKITAIGNIKDSEGMRKTEAEMKNSEFINLLNTNTAGAFKQDINKFNNGYPILNWQ